MASWINSTNDVTSCTDPLCQTTLCSLLGKLVFSSFLKLIFCRISHPEITELCNFVCRWHLSVGLSGLLFYIFPFRWAYPLFRIYFLVQSFINFIFCVYWIRHILRSILVIIVLSWFMISFYRGLPSSNNLLR